MQQDLYKLILKKLLSDMIVLRHKTHMYHWNAKGSNFLELHKLFQDQYEQILLNADRLAEYIKSKNVEIPKTLVEMVNMSSLVEYKSNNIKHLIEDHVLISIVCSKIASACNNNLLSSIMSDFEEYHNKQAWLLKNIE